MELWVRSQDRKLLEKAVMIKIGILEGTPVVVVNNDYVYGEYKTKERALEVLDEIQRHILKQGESYATVDDKGIITGIEYYGNIYEMPKE
jgi:hypothetical protein